MPPNRQKMSEDEWKAKVRTSSHVRSHERVTFTDVISSHRRGISAGISGTQVFLGFYFVKDDPGIEGTGWWHE